MTSPAGPADDRGISVYERGTSTAPYRPDRDISQDIDELSEIEHAIGGDPILSGVYRRLTAGGWRISRLALMEAYHLDPVRKTITFDARLDASRIPATVAKAIRQAYAHEPDMRLRSIHDRVLELLANRATAGAALTDLEIMAQTYTWAAWFMSSGGKPTYAIRPFPDIMADLLRVLSGERSAGRRRAMHEWGFTADATYYVGDRQFESTGFKIEFRELGNQVRHATAVLTLYAVFPRPLARFAAQDREVPGIDFADIRLNKHLQVISEGVAGSHFPYPDEFGNFIRQELGDPTQVAPWPRGLGGGLPDDGG